MATISWKGGNGDFDNGAKWSSGGVPGASDDASIAAAGSYTVSMNGDGGGVNSLTVGSGVTLAIDLQGNFLPNFSVAADLTNAGTITMGANSLFFVGTPNGANSVINNTGTIVTSDILALTAPAVTLMGGGDIILDGELWGNFNLFGLTPRPDASIQNVNNTISGSGFIASADLTNQTSGIIEANVDGKVLDLTTGNQVVNAGVLEATHVDQDNPGILKITDSVLNTGTILATGGGTVLVDASSVVANYSGASEGTLYATDSSQISVSGTVQGGDIRSDLESDIVSIGGTFDGTQQAISFNAVVEAGGGNFLTLLGTIENAGMIELSSGDLVVGANVTLSATGNIVMDAGSNIRAQVAGATLINIDNTISGSGGLGDSRVILINQGTVNANASDPLLASLGAGSLNSGTMEATGGGTLEFVRGSISNAGVIAAGNLTSGSGDGSQIIFLNNTLANNVGGVLTGGTWEAYAGDTLSLTGGAISKLAATAELFGAGSFIEAGNGFAQTPLEQSLTAITSTGKLVLFDRDYTTANTLALDGTLQLGFSTFTSGSITGTAASVLAGPGTVSAVIHDAGTVSAGQSAINFTAVGNTFSGMLQSGKTSNFNFSAGSDTLTSGASMGAGNYSIFAGASLTTTASVNCAGQISDAGTLLVSGGVLDVTGVNSLTGNGSNINGTVGGAGTLEIGGGITAFNTGANVTVGKVWVNGGTLEVETSLSYAQTFVQWAGALQIGSGDAVTLRGGTTFTGGAITGQSNSILALRGTTSLQGIHIGGGMFVESFGKTTEGLAQTVIGDGTTGSRLINESGATFKLLGGASLMGGSGSSFNNIGTIVQSSSGAQATAFDVVLSNTGSVNLTGATIDFGAGVTGTGKILIGAGTHAEFDATVAAAQTIMFNANTGDLLLNTAGAIAGKITGFAAGDTLSALGFSATPALHYAQNGATGTLTLTGTDTGGHAKTVTFTLTGTYTPAGFQVTDTGGVATIGYATGGNTAHVVDGFLWPVLLSASEGSNHMLIGDEHAGLYENSHTLQEAVHHFEEVALSGIDHGFQHDSLI